MSTERQEVEALAAALTEALNQHMSGVTFANPGARAVAESLLARGVRMPGSLDLLREAAQALVDALDRCKPTLDGYAVMAHVHGQRYNGPTFGVEWEALRTALGAPSSAPTESSGSVVGVDVARVHREEAPCE